MNRFYNRNEMIKYRSLPSKTFNAELSKTGVLEIDIFDFIDNWGVNSDMISQALKENRNANEIKVNINSPGGDALEGITINHLLSEAPLPVVVRVLGVAASAASIVAMAGDSIEIYESGFIMIHNAWTFAAGDKEEMLKISERLEKADSNIASIIAARTDLSRNAVLELMQAETWLDGEDAVEKGFADVLLTEKEKQIENSVYWDLSSYAKTPKQLLNLNGDSINYPQTKRDVERWLIRDVKLTRNVAKKVIAACSGGKTEDVESECDAELLALIKEFNNTIKQFTR